MDIDKDDQLMKLPNLVLQRKRLLSDRARKSLNIYCQLYSPCNRYLAAGDNTGSLSVWNISKAVAVATSEEVPQEEDEAARRAVLKCEGVHSGTVYALCGVEDDFFSASGPEIHAWKWKNLTTDGNTTPCFTLYTSDPSMKTIEGPVEINNLSWDTTSNTLLAACGDGRVQMFNLAAIASNTNAASVQMVQKTRRAIDTQGGMLHSVASLTKNRIVTGGEDGILRLWDTSGEHARMLESASTLKSKKKGKRTKWISVVLVDEQECWLLCGGGFGMSLYSLNSFMKVTNFSSSEPMNITDAKYTENGVAGVGSDSVVRFWAMNGDLQREIVCVPRFLFSVVFHTVSTEYGDTKISTIAGSGPLINIVTEMGNCTSLALEV
eukprot:m.217917 g.217917  ORF g.217917 m.217917 type:complete len:379 (+) comp15894_c3_seq1:183-1319(+)